MIIIIVVIVILIDNATVKRALRCGDYIDNKVLVYTILIIVT